MLEKLKGRFWTNVGEMIQDIKEITGFDVVDETYDSLTLENDEEEIVFVELVRAGSTIALR